MGVRDSRLEVIGWQANKFNVSMVVRNTSDNFVWKLVVVYGSAYEEGKQEFIDELGTIFDNWDGPVMVGWDFNIVRFQSEKNNGMINHQWSDAFNDWINKWSMIELKNPSRSYTWVNNQDCPIMAALDIVLVNTLFDQKFPLANVKANSRASSDHVPLVVNFGVHDKPKRSPFRFEKWWLQLEGFHDMVANIWNTPYRQSDPMEVWQFKVRLLRKKLKGWVGMLVQKLGRRSRPYSVDMTS